MNSCNPVFMEIGARVGAEAMLKYYRKLGLYEKTGVDLPGEAGSIMHKLENIGAVELATMSFVHTDYAPAAASGGQRRCKRRDTGYSAFCSPHRGFCDRRDYRTYL